MSVETLSNDIKINTPIRGYSSAQDFKEDEVTCQGYIAGHVSF